MASEISPLRISASRWKEQRRDSERLLYSLGIPGIGKANAKLIVKDSATTSGRI